jgi:hypothetical protein
MILSSYINAEGNCVMGKLCLHLSSNVRVIQIKNGGACRGIEGDMFYRILTEEPEGKYHLMYDIKADIKDRVTANVRFCLLGCGVK